MPTLRAGTALLVIGLGAAACLGVGEPEFVEYVATLQSPHGAEGAAVIEVRGEGLRAFESPNDQIYVGPIGESVRLVIVLAQPGTIEFTFTAQNSVAPTATVLEVSDGQNQPRGSLSDYSVELATGTS